LSRIIESESDLVVEIQRGHYESQLNVAITVISITVNTFASNKIEIAHFLEIPPHLIIANVIYLLRKLFVARTVGRKFRKMP